MMRIAGKTNAALAGNKKFDQLLMAVVKLHLIGGDAFY